MEGNRNPGTPHIAGIGTKVSGLAHFYLAGNKTKDKLLAQVQIDS